MRKAILSPLMLVILGSLSFSTGLQAQEHGQSSDQGAETGKTATFERLDQNDDGVLDEQELSAFGATSAGDEGNQNPHVEADERDRGERVLNIYDKDNDGEVTPEEFRKDRPAEEVWQ